MIVSIAFNFLMGFFICYYILKFSKDSTKNNNVVFDGEQTYSLDRNRVPNLVYMQNQKVLTRFIRGELRHRADQKKLVIL